MSNAKHFIIVITHLAVLATGSLSADDGERQHLTLEHRVAAQRAIREGPFEVIPNLDGPGHWRYVNALLDEGTEYRFRVFAYNEAGERSTPSHEVSARTF